MYFPHEGLFELQGFWKTGVPFPVMMMSLGGSAKFYRNSPKITWRFQDRCPFEELLFSTYCSEHSENTM